MPNLICCTRHANLLMKDFLDRWELLRGWMALGYPGERFVLKDVSLDEVEGERPLLATNHSRARAKLHAMIQAVPEQKRVAATLVNAIGSAKDGRHFVNGRAGSGKSTIACYIYHHCKDGGLQIINCATTGIAGLQSTRGRNGAFNQRNTHP